MGAATLALVTTVSGPPAAGVHQSSEPPALVTFTTPRFGARAPENVLVPTRHGDVYARIVRPATTQRVPVLLTYTPYSVLGAGDSSWVAYGYARVVADVLGTGSSGGCWDYGGTKERESAYDLVEWLGTRSWSIGKVAMTGASYDGTTANMAAAANPPHLATVIPQVAIGDWYGYAYHDGVRYLAMDPAQRQGTVIDEQGFDTPALFDFGFGLAPPTNRGDAGWTDRVVARACPGGDKAVHSLRGYSTQPDYDAFWRERGYVHDAGRLAEPDGLEIPVLVQGGWRDWNVKRSESTRWFDAVPVDDPDTPADEGVPYKMLVMGQGAHGSAEGELGFSRIVHAWLDRYLYDYPTNVDRQPQLVSRTNDGVVHRDRTWPPPTTAGVRLHLRAAGSLTTGGPTADEASDAFVDTGRTSESDALNLRGVRNPEVLWYETAPLTADLRVAGLPSLDLFAATTGTSTHFTPVLFDLGPPVTQSSAPCTYAGAVRACTITRGFLNARYRDGLGAGRDLVPLEPYRATVRFVDVDWVVKAGHRIVLTLMSSNVWWATPDPQRSVNVVAQHEASPSAIVLPIVGGPQAAAAAGL